MRRKLVKTEANILRVFGYLNFLGAGYNISWGVIHDSLLSLLLGILGLLVGISAIVVWFNINYPKIPKWAEEDFEMFGK